MAQIGRTLFKSIRVWRGVAFAFAHGERGNIAVTFALALLPAIGLVGAAVDFSRGNSLQAALQSAVDSTALYVAREAKTDTADQLQAAAANNFKSVFTRPEAKDPTITASYSSSGGSSVVITATTKLDTEFMGIFGYEEMTITATSTVRWGSARLRVALVLDNTGSMASDGKMTALKKATRNLLSDLKGAAASNGDVYVSIVPFAKDIAVNPAHYNSSWDTWITWDANRPVSQGGAPLMAPANSLPDSSVGPNSNCPYSTSDERYTCVTQAGGTTPASKIPSTGQICPSNSFGCYDSVEAKTPTDFFTCLRLGFRNCACGANGCFRISYSHNWSVDKTKIASRWNGCITDRGNSAPPLTDYDQWATKPASASIPDSMFPAQQFGDRDTNKERLAQPYGDCPRPMMGLTYDWSALNNLVDAMTPKGSTNQPIGLVWGWQSLVGGGPFIVPPMAGNDEYFQVIILLSDGLNTQNRWDGDGSNVSIPVDKRMYDNGAGTCANFKNAGTGKIRNVIYAIQVNTGGDPTSTLLKNCASPDDTDPKGQKFFLLTSADQIVKIFEQIGTNLTKLHLAR
jgi:Flp pilus assembly protein TadG